MQQQSCLAGADDPALGLGRLAATTFDEESMERSKGFVKALQVNCCQFSVLDNLKDYAVRALVNAVDHLGTVAYKLADLYELQASEVSTLELKVASLNQQVLTCQTYTDKEGLRQQQMIGNTTTHHKHYIVLLPSAENKRMQAFTDMQKDIDFDWRPKLYPSAKTLHWHLASEKNSKSDGGNRSGFVKGETKSTNPTSSGGFHLRGKESSAPVTGSDIVMHNFGMKDQPGTRHLSSFSSFENPRGHQVQKAPLRTKSMLAAFFVRHRSGKMKNVSVR